ncbi:MAG: hypothetical protein PHR77_02620 [Kiritimatiellae bacterium]|nr:hypothetical protein [Kiritimatiellia bacterium]MDD5523353.1 hypothetical protein [Kiritimatiellia bacterium]
MEAPYDWIEPSYTQNEVDRVYEYLGKRDKHIYNTGLANLKETREANQQLLQRVLGVPIEVIWNPTVGQIGNDIGAVGQAIGRRGWSWNPLKVGANVVGGLVEAGAIPVEIAGYGVDWAVAPLEKIPVLRTVEPTYILTKKAYLEALKYVMAQKDTQARVWAWMHSEGAIHGLTVFGNLSPEMRSYISGYTFGGGKGDIPKKMDIKRLGLKSDNRLRRWLLIDKDGVAAIAGGGILRKYDWMTVDKGYVHGFDVYLETWVPIKAKEYFEVNARQILDK